LSSQNCRRSVKEQHRECSEDRQSNHVVGRDHNEAKDRRRNETDRRLNEKDRHESEGKRNECRPMSHQNKRSTTCNDYTFGFTRSFTI
jgi:hypothetical protein